MNNQSNKFSNITKKHITKMSRNSKLKEKYYINEKIHLATEKIFVLHHSLKINKRGGLVSSGGEGLEKNQKINKRSHPHPCLLGTLQYICIIYH